MNILSGHAQEAAARATLQRSRRQAGGLLLAAVLLFIVSALFVQRHPALGYLKAFAEAATVGALADWFAVTALFRHPLGLKIPHTAILPRNQNRIADELGRFIETNFLPACASPKNCAAGWPAAAPAKNGCPPSRAKSPPPCKPSRRKKPPASAPPF